MVVVRHDSNRVGQSTRIAYNAEGSGLVEVGEGQEKGAKRDEARRVMS